MRRFPLPMPFQITHNRYREEKNNQIVEDLPQSLAAKS